MGSPSAPSTRRIRPASTMPPQYPATSPTSAPSVTDRPTALYGDCYGERDATAGGDPRQHVAAQLIGAEWMRDARRQAHPTDRVWLSERVGEQWRCHDRRHGDRQQDERSHAPSRRAPGPPQRVQQHGHENRTRGSRRAYDQIGDQAAPDDQDGDEQRGAHEQRIVPIPDRADGQRTESGPGEHRLDEHRARSHCQRRGESC